MLNERYGSPDWGHVLQLLWTPTPPADEASSIKDKTPPPADEESRQPTPPASQYPLEEYRAALEAAERLEVEMDSAEVVESNTPKSNGKRKQGELTFDEDGADYEPVKAK